MWITRKIRKHPIYCAISALVFVFIPSIIQPWWGLFSNEPMVPVITKKLEDVNMSNISFTWLYWITIPVGFGMLGYIVYLTRKDKLPEIVELVDKRNIISKKRHVPKTETIKKSRVKQKIERKTEIINQLNQFVRNGNDLLIKIHTTHISQFPSKSPLKENDKPTLVEREVAIWNLEVYDYLNANVPSQAEYYHRLSTRNIPSINHSKNPQEKTRAALIALMEEDIERIIEIIKYVDSSGD